MPLLPQSVTASPCSTCTSTLRARCVHLSQNLCMLGSEALGRDELTWMRTWAQNLVAGQLEDFRRQLHQMWFSLYSRSHVRDSTCGFEHGS